LLFRLWWEIFYYQPVLLRMLFYYKSRIWSLKLQISCTINRDYKIWGFHGGDYEEYRLLGCYAMLAFVETDVSEDRMAPIIEVARFSHLGTTIAVINNRCRLRKCSYTSHTASHTRRRNSLQSPSWKPHILHSINRLDSVAEM
jgi:hypothetical protein